VLGIGKSATPADYVYDSTVRSTNDVLFVVASYERTGTGTVASLWINPSVPSFGANAAPAPTLVCTAGTNRDLNTNGVRAFVIACQNANAPAGQLDELRIAGDWRFVTSSQSSARPNILFVLCDDLGYGDLGILHQNSRNPGQPRHFTPKLDTLAIEGMQLHQHYCPAPICAPSRSSLLLGVHQGHANVRDTQWDKALADNHTLGTVLKAAGYATCAIGKWGLHGKNDGTSPSTWPAFPTKRGFDHFFGYLKHGDGHEHYPKEALYIATRKSKECYDGTINITTNLDKCYTTDLFTARAKKWIVDHQNRRNGQPFFMYLAFDTPHSVYELPTQAYPAGGGTNGGMQWLGTPGSMISTASGTVDSWTHPSYANATYDHDNDPDTAEVGWPEVFKRFATAVRRIDDAVGDLKAVIRDLGIETNTVLVFTSDNGPTTEDALGLPITYSTDFFDNFGPLDGIKADTWEGGIRVPTLVRWPGKIEAASTNFTPSQFQDWLPTFAQLAGVPVPSRTDGVTLLPSLLGTGRQREGTLYVEFAVGGSTPNYAEFEPYHRNRIRGQMQVVRLNGLQGVRYNILSASDDFELYDVLNDPKQKFNLAVLPEYASLQQKMKDRVLQLRRSEPESPRPYDNEFVPAIPVDSPVQGVDWSACADAFPWVPDMMEVGPLVRGIASSPALSVLPRANDVAIRFGGFLRIPADGDYTFYLSADSGALMRIHDAIVIDADFGYARGSEAAGVIKLRAGYHPFRLDYARGSIGAPSLQIAWSGPGISKQAIPTTTFFRTNPRLAFTSSVHADRLVLDWSGDFVLQSSTNAAGPFSDMPNAQPPYTNEFGNQKHRFFRLRN
jgi:arylsulfatase A-like enzyme